VCFFASTADEAPSKYAQSYLTKVGERDDDYRIIGRPIADREASRRNIIHRQIYRLAQMQKRNAAKASEAGLRH
jgi:hypothetical protein